MQEALVAFAMQVLAPLVSPGKGRLHRRDVVLDLGLVKLITHLQKLLSFHVFTRKHDASVDIKTDLSL
jgi:hypothetical protein